MIVFGKHRRAQDNLSAYADGELSSKDKQALEDHLEACEQCRLDLDGLRATMGALRSLPDVEPRRSFALTSEMVTPARPAPRPGPAPALTYGTRLAAAGLAAALVIVFAIDFSDSDTGGGDAGETVNFSAERGPSALEDAADGSLLEATIIPESAGTLAPPSPQATGGAGGGVGGVPAETPATVGGGTADNALDDEGKAASDGEDVAADSPPANREALEFDDSSQGAAPGNDTDAVGSPERPASPGGDEGGFDTLLALEIGLVAAFAVVLAVAVWLTIAARQRETRP